MKTLTAFAMLLALASSTLAKEPDPAGYVDFGKFDAAEGSQFVEVHVRSNLIAMVTKLAQQQEPSVAEVLKGLKAVRVNVIGLTDENKGDIRKRIKDIRQQLDARGWESLVTAQNKDEDIRVFLKTRGADAVEGLVVTILQGGREAVLINIVGDIKPEKVAMIGERFHIEPLKQVGEKLARK